MFLIDNILLAPARGLLNVFREIQEAAKQELANEAEAIREQLAALYRMLESGQIAEEEFDATESALLDRLDVLESGSPENEAEEDADEEEDGEDETEIEESEEDVHSLTGAGQAP